MADLMLDSTDMTIRPLRGGGPPQAARRPGRPRNWGADQRYRLQLGKPLWLRAGGWACKLYWGAGAAAMAAAEADANRRARQHPFWGAYAVPAEPVPGMPWLLRSPWSDDRGRDREARLDALLDDLAAYCRRSPPRPLPALLDVEGAPLASALDLAWQALVARTAPLALPAGASHGDLRLENLRSGAGGLGIIDWDAFRETSSPVGDVARLVLNRAARRDGIVDSLRMPPGTAAAQLRQAAARHGGLGCGALAALAFYYLRIARGFAGRPTAARRELNGPRFAAHRAVALAAARWCLAQGGSESDDRRIA